MDQSAADEDEDSASYSPSEFTPRMPSQAESHDHTDDGEQSLNSIQLLSVYFLNIRASQSFDNIQDLQKDGDIAQLRMSGTLLP